MRYQIQRSSPRPSLPAESVPHGPRRVQTSRLQTVPIELDDRSQKSLGHQHRAAPQGRRISPEDVLIPRSPLCGGGEPLYRCFKPARYGATALQSRGRATQSSSTVLPRTCHVDSDTCFSYPTLLFSWWCTGFAGAIILARIWGRFIRTGKLFREDKIMAWSLIPLLIRMALVHVILLYGTNNVLTEGLTERQIYHRSIGSRLVLASRIFYAMCK